MLKKISITKPFFLNINSKIIDAFKIINSNQVGACILTNSKGEFISLITDGDLRRLILSNIDLNGSLTFFINKKTRVLKDPCTEIEVKKFMRRYKVLQVPVLKNNKCNYLYFYNSLDDEKILEDFVILAGGFGKRLLPITESKPKALVELFGKPLLLHILEKAVSEGFVNFKLVLFHKYQMIINFLKNHKITKNINIDYIIEKKPLGTVGGISLIKNFSSKHFILTNCDVMADLSYKSLLNYQIEKNSLFTLSTKRKFLDIPYGVTLQKKSKLISIKEKPKFEIDVNCGIYVMRTDILDYISKNKKLDINELISILLEKNKQIITFPLIENWNDIGQKDQLIEFNLK